MHRRIRLERRWFAALAGAAAMLLALLATLLPASAAYAAGSTLTLSATVAEQGETITVDYTTDAPDSKNWIAIYRASDGTPDGNPASRAYAYAPLEQGRVSFTLTASTFLPGEYRIYFLAQDGYGALTEPVALTVADPDSAPEPEPEPEPDPAASGITLSSSEVHRGDTLRVDYRTSDPSQTNWIGIYRESDGTPDADPGSRIWSYAPEEEGTVSFPISLSAGSYLVYLLADDGYEQLTAPVPFTVLPDPADVTSRVADYTTGDARVGETFSAKLDVLFNVAGADPASVTVVDAPDWATLSDGILTGTPASEGEFVFTVRAEAGGKTAETQVTVPVVAADAALGDDLRVVTYNAWHEGSQVAEGQDKELTAFLEQGADIVALQESSAAHAGALADALGWYSHSGPECGNCTIISRYPFGGSASGSAAVGAEVLVDPVKDRSLWIWSAHLGYTRYGPYYAQEGRSIEYILSEEEAQRGPQTRQTIEVMDQVAAEHPGAPMIYAGDLNVPSHLDWVEGNRAEHGGLIVPWPTSVALEEAGFVDTYRAIHLDPLTDPATSWTPRFPEEPQDRIDFIHLRGDAITPVDSVYFHGASMDDWASDHGSFTTEFVWDDAADPEPTPDPTPDPEPSPSPDPVIPVPTPSDEAPTGAEAKVGSLPVTGASPLAALLIGTVTVVAGLVLTLSVLRRRRRAERQ
ncbi:hypothetical protein GCM10027416_24740 [Okibacterium endophyticum]